MSYHVNCLGIAAEELRTIIVSALAGYSEEIIAVLEHLHLWRAQVVRLSVT